MSLRKKLAYAALFYVAWAMLGVGRGEAATFPWVFREHATDCPSITDGATNHLCHELDSDRFFRCEPSIGLCDTSGEWTEIKAKLPADPGACTAGQYVTDIDNAGTLTCAQVAFSQLSGSATDGQVPNNITIDLATLASTVTVADTTDSTSFVALFESATGSLAAKTDLGLTYDASNASLTANTFVGTLLGTATSASVADTVIVTDGSSTSSYLAMFDAATGNLIPHTDPGIRYNATTFAVTHGDGSTASVAMASNLSGATDPTLTFGNAMLTVSHDLTISGDDLFMATNTSGAVLVADGTNFNPVVMSGDAVIDAAGAVAIQANAVALTTDTTGNYVLDVADGTGIDGTAAGEGATYTPTLDLTEISSATLGAGAFTTLTFDAGATDPVLTASSGFLDLTTGTLRQGGVEVCLEDGTNCPAGGAGDITAVGDIVSGAAFTSGVPGNELYIADGGWVGNSGTGLRIEFDSSISPSQASLVGGNFYVNTTSGDDAFDFYGIDGALNVANEKVSVLNASATASAGAQIWFSRTRGTITSPVIVNSGDRLGAIEFWAQDGAPSYERSSAIYAEVDGTPASNDVPGRLIFATTPAGSTTPTERLRIDSAGAIDAGAASSFELPNGANPTTDSAGEIAVDTSAAPGSMVRFYGDAAYALPGTQHASFCITGTTAAGDFGAIHKYPYAITIKAVHVVMTGGTNVVGHLDECDSAGASCAGVDGATDITADGGLDSDDGSLSNASIDAGDQVGWHTTSVSGTNTRLNVTYYYTVDQVN